MSSSTYFSEHYNRLVHQSLSANVVMFLLVTIEYGCRREKGRACCSICIFPKLEHRSFGLCQTTSGATLIHIAPALNLLLRCVFKFKSVILNFISIFTNKSFIVYLTFSSERRTNCWFMPRKTLRLLGARC